MSIWEERELHAQTIDFEIELELDLLLISLSSLTQLQASTSW